MSQDLQKFGDLREIFNVFKWGQFKPNVRAVQTKMRAIQTKMRAFQHTEFNKISNFRGLKKILNSPEKIQTRSNRDLQSLEHLLTKKQPKQTRITTLKRQSKQSMKKWGHFNTESVRAFQPEGNSYQMRGIHTRWVKIFKFGDLEKFSTFSNEGNSN